MRIDRLDLIAFGPFSGQSLALDGGQCGLHIIYGTNEAGKSSALRALRQLLYGIPHASNDNFLHAHTDLRIGATLRESDGETLDCIRRKGKTNTLRGPDDVAIVEPARLARLLGGLDEIGFALQFGIDSAALENGGRAIVEGRGELGTALFAAGSGIVDLRRVQESLTAEARELFVPSGRNPLINKALAELAEAKKRVKASQLQSDEWVKLDEELRAATTRRQAIDEQLLTRNTERGRWERLEKAQPWVARRKQALAALSAVADAVLLSPDFPERRRRAQHGVQTKQLAADEAKALATRLQEQLAELNPPQKLLQNQTVVQLLYEDLGAHRKAQLDRPNLEKLRQSHQDAASATLRELVPTADLSRAEGLRLTRVERSAIQTLGQIQKGLEAKRDAVRQQVENLQHSIDHLERELGSDKSLPDSTPLRTALRAFAGFRELELRLAQDRANVAQSERQAQSALKRLPRWRGELDQLEKLAVPSAETVDRFENELGAAEQEIKSLDQRTAQLADNAREIEQNLERLRLARDVPTEDDLTTARQRRDKGWELVRRAWQERSSGDTAAAEFAEEFGSAGDLATAYVTSVSRADSVADRLRREAEYVAQKAQFLASKQKIAESLERLALQRAECHERFSAATQRWRELWSPLAIDPGSPREMRAWLVQHAQLVNSAAELRRHQILLNHLEQSAQDCCTELKRVLADCGQLPRDTISCSVLYEQAEAVADNLDAQRTAQRDRQNELTRLQKDLQDASRGLKAATEEYDNWQNQWRQALGRLELPGDASPAAVNDVLTALDGLFGDLQKAKDLDRRIEGIDRDADKFAQRLRDIAEQVDFELAGQPVDRAVSALYDRLLHGQKVQIRFEELQQQYEREQANHDRLQRETQEHQTALEVMCAEAQVKHVEELPAAEQRSAQRRQLEEQIRDFEGRILDLAGGTKLTDFINEASATATDEIHPTISKLSAEIAELEHERTDVDRSIGSQREALKRMDGSAAAAIAQEEVSSLAAQVRTHAEQYRQLKLASVVLAQAIERYRERHQGPVVQMASQLFAQLTLGSFEGLRADYSEAGQAVLVGVRPGGRQTVLVECMSSGARDQLYLALRLASLHNYLDTKEPLPFIVDDVLVQFDDARSAAALEALADLSRRTQVIFFTHHEHLVELATRCLKPDVLYKHRLDCRTVPGTLFPAAGSVTPVTKTGGAGTSSTVEKPSRGKASTTVRSQVT